MAGKMRRSHTIPKQTHRVRVRVTSGERLREEATYTIRATNALEAFDRAGIDGLQFFNDDDEAYGHTSPTSAAAPAARSTASMASSPPRRTVAVVNGRSQDRGRRRVGSSR